MNVETLKFLLTASEYLKINLTECVVARDLQAVERVLPDCDWFEFAEPGDHQGRFATALWSEQCRIEIEACGAAPCVRCHELVTLVPYRDRVA